MQQPEHELNSPFAAPAAHGASATTNTNIGSVAPSNAPSPSTPLSSQQSPQPSTQHILQLTPSQAEALAGFGLSSLITTTPSDFSPGPVVSPQSPAYSQHSNDLGGGGAILSPFGRPSSGAGINPTNSAGIAAASTPSATTSSQPPPSTMVPRALAQEIDLAFPVASSAASTPSAAPRAGGYYYPATAAPAHATTVQRHHPYAHPTHPNRPTHSQTASTSALPLYLSTPPVASPLPTSSASADPPQPQPNSIVSPAGSLGFPPVQPLGPLRVHSAPAHILSLANVNGTGEGMQQAMAGVESEGAGPLGDAGAYTPTQAGPEWDPATGLPLNASAVAANGLVSSAPGSVGGDWEGERGMVGVEGQQPPQVKQEDQAPPPAGFFDGAFNYATASPVYNHALPPPPPQPAQSAPLPMPPAPSHDTVVSAITLLRNRLPIMEAALSTSASEPGNDEEEIWKGVEGAYGELRRIMMSRKDARRGLASLKTTTVRSVASVALVYHVLTCFPSACILDGSRIASNSR